MNKEDYISTLPQAEQKALAVCGIYKAQQLRNISMSALYADMQQAAAFFSDDIELLSKERLAEIYSAAAAATPADEHPAEEQADKTPESEPEIEYTRNLPPLVRKHGTRHRSPNKVQTDTIDLTKSKAPNKEKTFSDKSNAICNTHPFRTLFSAIVQVWLITAVLLFIIIATRLVLRIDTNITYTQLVIMLLSGILPYLCYTRKTKCPVCNISIFTFQNFVRNKHAHHLPILGYTLTTALHIIFFFWFRCPACGTAQKLFKRKRR